ncbi:unnamed protein product [Clonostachys rosea]|uniref:PHD-type domain-containing protein n=1 Tax=Bionectria ochroleuca TaxID=29856 RepID=A0ABY6TU79_BIOOC|nr:unnamed protein product [Clonostachys rosea]
MISSNTRASRSRYSSPAHQQQQNGGGKGDGNGTHEVPKPSANDRSRAFMERWLEPSLQNKPSFEEAGLMRHGVLETMAPLGTLPKPKKGGQDSVSASAVRKIILRPSGAGSAGKAATNDGASSPLSTTAAVADLPTSTANTAASTTATTPSSKSPSPILDPPASAPATVTLEPASKTTGPLSTSRKQARKSLSLQKEELDDDDYEPRKPHRKQSTISSLPPKKGRPPLSARRSSHSQPSAPQSPVKGRLKMQQSIEPGGNEFAEKVVEAAVQEALDHHRYPTAWALKKLYEENAGDAAFVTMVEDVFTQTADENTLQDFSSRVKKKKREGNKDKQACYRFFQLTTNKEFTPQKALPAPYAHLIHHDEEEDEPEPRATKKIKVTHSKAAKATSRRASLASSATVNGNKLRTPGSRRRARRGSGSSDSSLSSAISLSSPEVTRVLASPTPGVRRARAKAKEQEEEAVVAPATTSTIISTTANSNSEPQSQSSGAPKTRPITTRGKSLASSKHQQTAASNTSRPNSPTLSSSAPRPQRKKRAAVDDASMPGRLVPEEPPVSKSFTTPSAKNSLQAQMLDGYEDSWDRRRHAQKVTNNYTALESSIREAEEEQLSTPAKSTRRSTRQSLNAPPSTRATRSARKRSIEVSDTRTASPVSVVNHGGEGSSVMGSRAVTPTNLPPAKKQKTGLRVKLSPIKKKGGTAAGLPRLQGEGQIGSAQGAQKEQASDNDEYCSACGNVGDVVCCDGCPRSFHFECVDMDRDEDLPAEWYCNECLVKNFPSRVPVHKGVFGAALNSLEKCIPRAFSLPKKLQNRFEGVRAGADGDYEEVSSNRARKKTSGYEEAPDFFRQRDDGEAVLCHDCQKPATDIRAIIPCSVCSLYWHTDCLDPPLAVPPVLKTWRCPAHADELLAEAPPLAPAHRFRKIKGAHIITPAIGRGLKNNGHIEIDWSEEPDLPDHSGWKDYASFGRTYKIPAQGVVLDFIERMQKQKHAVTALHEDEPRRTAPYLTPPVEDRDRLPPPNKVPERSVDEMQASLILTSLCQPPAQGVDQLTSALLASADSNVIALIAQGNAANIAREQLQSTDRLSLQTLLVQMENMSSTIRQILTGEDSTNLGASVIQKKKAAGSIKPDPLLIEPTPPSTFDHTESVMDLD